MPGLAAIGRSFLGGLTGHGAIATTAVSSRFFLQQNFKVQKNPPLRAGFQVLSNAARPCHTKLSQG